MLAEIVTSAASWQTDQPFLTYFVPAELEDSVHLGQLVAIPYGEHLVEGIIWHLRDQISRDRFIASSDQPSTPLDHTLRPISTILDPEPALIAHQRILAEWMAEYYVTPLAQVAQMMLPPGLIQRSQVVLQLVKNEEQQTGNASLQLQALIGLLLAEGELDIERLKEMLGPKKTRELLKESLASGLVAREAQLQAPRVRARRKRVVQLIAQPEHLMEWRQQKEHLIQESLPEPSLLPVAPDNVRRRPQKPHPWAVPGSSEVFALTPVNEAALLAQHQLAVIDLLLHSQRDTASHWTPHKLCQASGLTPAQLQALVRESLVSIEEVEIQRNPLLGRLIQRSSPLQLTSDQQKALNAILSSTTPLLLHGVTGSGKTEVYLQALDALIVQGKRGIVLVPEIALTAQAIQRFAGRFPDRVAIIHSALGAGERYDEWRRIRSGKVDVVIGSRSALFAPLPDLGIIILDEEHEPAYKQDERRPTYHARQCAIALGQMLNIPVVLGSATPSVETFYHTEQGRYRLVELPNRIGATLPPVEIIDLRSELHAGNTSIISRRLYSELERVLRSGQQAILYLNRRGAASCVLCRDCGFVAMCDRCDMPLTYHSTEHILLCHYCNRQSKVLYACPQCNSKGIRYFGLGTEKVQETIQRSFPEARILSTVGTDSSHVGTDLLRSDAESQHIVPPSARLLRWDRDTARNRQAHEQLLERFANREADILIGTQMIAKGLDIPGVTLVGVISADIALNLPDFSASERTFTLLTQVAGRAGRGEQAGQVIIQTFNPQHFCIDAASRHAYKEFYEAEIEVRRRYGYPPFRQFVKFTYSHENRRRSQNEALLLREKLDEWIDRLKLPQTDVVGPAPAIIERIHDKYRWQMIARGPDLSQLLRVIEIPQGWAVDIDPVSTM